MLAQELITEELRRDVRNRRADRVLKRERELALLVIMYKHTRGQYPQGVDEQVVISQHSALYNSPSAESLADMSSLIAKGHVMRLDGADGSPTLTWSGAREVEHVASKTD